MTVTLRAAACRPMVHASRFLSHKREIAKSMSGFSMLIARTSAIRSSNQVCASRVRKTPTALSPTIFIRHFSNAETVAFLFPDRAKIRRTLNDHPMSKGVNWLIGQQNEDRIFHDLVWQFDFTCQNRRQVDVRIDYTVKRELPLGSFNPIQNQKICKRLSWSLISCADLHCTDLHNFDFIQRLRMDTRINFWDRFKCFRILPPSSSKVIIKSTKEIQQHLEFNAQIQKLPIFLTREQIAAVLNIATLNFTGLPVTDIRTIYNVVEQILDLEVVTKDLNLSQEQKWIVHEVLTISFCEMYGFH